MIYDLLEALYTKVPTRILVAMHLALLLYVGTGAHQGFNMAHDLKEAPCRYATEAPRYSEEMSEVLCKDLGVPSQSQPTSP